MDCGMNYSRDTIFGLWLLNCLGAGNTASACLCEHFDSFEEIYNAPMHTIMEIEGIKPGVAEKLNFKNLDDANMIAEECEILGVDIITYYDVKYPSSLKNIANFPPLLFVKGKLPDENDLCIAVVGSRKPSIYGSNIAEKISKGLAEAGVVIVSGMARGVDSYAHRGALQGDADTIAVLGCGIDVVYPPENKELGKLIACNGALVSEFLPKTPPLPAYFPLRNRIISGLSSAVLVVEGKASSGSTITANLAANQGREVFCVPGNVDNPLSSAPNQLIRQGARLVTCAKDILEDMASGNPDLLNNTIFSEETKEKKEDARFNKLTFDQKAVVRVLETDRPRHIDEICFEAGMEISLANQCLFMLELNGMVRQLPGKLYILCK